MHCSSIADCIDLLSPKVIVKELIFCRIFHVKMNWKTHLILNVGESVTDLRWKTILGFNPMSSVSSSQFEGKAGFLEDLSSDSLNRLWYPRSISAKVPIVMGTQSFCKDWSGLRQRCIALSLLFSSPLEMYQNQGYICNSYWMIDPMESVSSGLVQTKNRLDVDCWSDFDYSYLYLQGYWTVACRGYYSLMVYHFLYSLNKRGQKSLLKKPLIVPSRLFFPSTHLLWLAWIPTDLAWIPESKVPSDGEAEVTGPQGWIQGNFCPWFLPWTNFLGHILLRSTIQVASGSKFWAQHAEISCGCAQGKGHLWGVGLVSINIYTNYGVVMLFLLILSYEVWL